jgi:hypothetical protein
MKRFFLFIALLVLITVIVVAYLMLRKEDTVKTPVDNGVDLPIGGGTNENPNTNVNINSILSNPKTTDLGSGAYIIAGGDGTTIDTKYQIGYYAPDQSYTISLLTLPLKATRIEAEQNFLQTTKLSKEEACKERVMVATPFEISTEYSGKDLGMSFCPGSVTLP